MSLEAEIHFSLSILKRSNVEESAVMSPLSVALALALVHAGAEGNSKKEICEVIAKDASNEQLLEYYKTVGEDLLKKSEVNVKLANRIFIKESFKVKQTYLDKIMKTFDAKAVNLDFGNKDKCSKIVNEFVEEVTGGMIKDIVKSDTFKNSVFILINAIYFNGEWAVPFGYSYNSDFHVNKGETKKVKFMNLEDVHHPYVQTDDVQMFSKSYKDNNFCFIVVLPKKKFDLAAVRKNLTAKKLTDLMSRFHPHLMHIKMPKFKIETTTPLVDVLKALGINEVFTNCANLDGIAEEIHISKARHKTIIEVDEIGTKAAASTAVDFGRNMAAKKIIPFNADHPFLFFLAHKKNIVFCGQYNG